MAHPIHPALVHFPIACWSLATAGDVASLPWGAQMWWLSSVLLGLGLITSLAAMVAGLVDLGKIAEESPAMPVANWHMRLVVMAWSAYATSLFMRMNGTNLTPPSGAAIGLSILGFLLLGVAGWLGGRLVYEYGIGVDK